jgi:hypothetical protein
MREHNAIEAANMSARPRNPKAVLFLFLICAVLDFAWGYFRGHTFVAALTSAILGLGGTAYYCLAMFYGKDGGGNASGGDVANLVP